MTVKNKVLLLYEMISFRVEEKTQLINRSLDILTISSIFEKENKKFNQQKFNEKLYTNLRECVKHHQAILNIGRILKETMQPLFFLNMCLTTGFISIFLFLLIYVSVKMLLPSLSSLIFGGRKCLDYLINKTYTTIFEITNFF